MTIQRQRIYVLIFITCAIGLGVIVYLNSLANTYDKEHKKIALGLFNPDLQKLTDLRPEVFKTDKFIQMDLRDKFDILKTCAFHSLTKWPPKEKLPGNFDPLEFIDMGKDPGLGIRDLHRKGITGKGVNVAIIDYSLLRAHEEFREKVALYRNTDGKEAEPGSKSMHGTAVASLLVGDTCGVAPGATLHYWGEARAAAGYVHKIEGIKQILAFNENKELKDRIRVLSISVGADPKVNHYKEFKNILAVAREKGLLVVIVYDWLHGVGCSLYKDRNEPGNYQMWLRTQGLENRMPPGELYVPCDYRSTACRRGVREYNYWGNGGLSWAVPYLAGAIALAYQVTPNIKEEDIFKYIRETGTPFNRGVLINPTAFIEKVKTAGGEHRGQAGMPLQVGASGR